MFLLGIIFKVIQKRRWILSNELKNESTGHSRTFFKEMTTKESIYVLEDCQSDLLHWSLRQKFILYLRVSPLHGLSFWIEFIVRNLF